MTLMACQVFAATSAKPCNGQAGTAHPNGGGFVSAKAKVAKNVFVNARSQICDRVEIQNSGWIENTIMKGDGVVAIETPIRNSMLVGHFLVQSEKNDSPILDGAMIFAPDYVTDKTNRDEWIRISGKVEIHGLVMGRNITLKGETTIDQGLRISGNNLNLEDTRLLKMVPVAPSQKTLKKARLAGSKNE